MAGKRQIKIIITKEGKATIEVDGVSGPDCIEFTKFLEEALAAGESIEREKTGEYYQRPREPAEVEEHAEVEEKAYVKRRNVKRNESTPPSSLNLAVESYKTFTSKEPRHIEALPSSIKFPREIGYAGTATEINYCSDKWYKDKTVLYYHPTESNVGTYFPWDCYEWLKPVSETPTWPSELWMLGLTWGFTFKRHDNGELLTCEWKVERAKGVSWSDAKRKNIPVLAGAPDTHMLCIIHPKDGVLAMFFGGNLKVTERGIEG